MNVPAAAVAYLETGHYNANGWRRAITLPLMELRAEFETEIYSSFADQHEQWCTDLDDLCTGDGYRWYPPLVKLRFR